MGENGTGKRFTPAQRRGLELLVLGLPAAKVAETVGIARRTVYRWLKDPAFTAELRRLDGDNLRRLGRMVMALSEAAAQALQDALDKAQPIGVRLRAAAIVCDKGPALSELTGIIERLEALEAACAQRDQEAVGGARAALG